MTPPDLTARAEALVQSWAKHWAEDKLFNDPPVFPSGLIQRELDAALQEVMEEEREACAKVALHAGRVYFSSPQRVHPVATQIAAAIRRRAHP